MHQHINHNDFKVSRTYEAPDLSAGVNYWQYRYDRGHTEWQLEHVYPTLVKYYDKLNPNGEACSVFYPMCGLSLDMAWFLEQGLTVVGVELVPQVLTEFISKSSQHWTNLPVPLLGSHASVYRRKDNRIRLYCADMQDFSSEIEGRFDLIWDRGSIQYVCPENVQRYVRTLKNLLKPGGRMLLETVEYDQNILRDDKFKPPIKVPPPFPMSPRHIMTLYEPECTVEHLEQYTSDRLHGAHAQFHVHLVVRK